MIISWFSGTKANYSLYRSFGQIIGNWIGKRPGSPDPTITFNFFASIKRSVTTPLSIKRTVNLVAEI